MHIPSSLLNPLLALLALTPSIAANPVAQSANEVIDPIPPPDFSRCNFIQIVRTSIEGAFTLTALSDTLPLQSWPVQLRSPSAKTAQSPFISRTKIAPPLFKLTEGSLNATSSDGASYPGRFVPIFSSNLQRFLFGGRGEPSDFYWIQKCDATGMPYAELKAGRDLLIKDFAEGAAIFGKDVEDAYPRNSRKIHLRINTAVTT